MQRGMSRDALLDRDLVMGRYTHKVSYLRRTFWLDAFAASRDGTKRRRAAHGMTIGAYLPLLLMEMVVDRFGHRLVDALDFQQIRQAGARNGFG